MKKVKMIFLGKSNYGGVWPFGKRIAKSSSLTFKTQNPVMDITKLPKTNTVNPMSLRTVDINHIKVDLVQASTDEQLLKALSHWHKTLMPVKYPIVHEGSMQLIGNKDLYDAAIADGRTECVVTMLDFPEKDLIIARALYGEKPTSFVAKAQLAPIYETVFNSRKLDYTLQDDDSFIATLARKYSGEGAVYREDQSELSLRSFVAKLLGTNAEYLRKIKAIAAYDQELLAWLDRDLENGRRLNPDEAFAMVPQKPKSGKPAPEKERTTNQIEHIGSLDQLDAPTLALIKEVVPQKYRDAINGGEIPDDLFVFRSPNSKEAPAICLTFELGGRSINTQIVNTQKLTGLLRKVA